MLQAMTVMVPEIIKDIKGDKNEARGIGKYLYRPQVRRDTHTWLHLACRAIATHSLLRFQAARDPLSLVGYMQIWSRGTADSCFYMGDQYQFCNIDMFRRRSRYPPPDAPLASC